MKGHKIRPFALACAAALGFAALGGMLQMGAGERVSASANSAPSYWSGTAASGAIVTDGQCPVEVESEKLTFDIPHTPKNRYEDAEEFSSYGATVTAEYRFYNPTDMDVQMELAFPFGSCPDYLREKLFLFDSQRYAITADGAEVPHMIRHTYSRGSLKLDLDDIGSIFAGPVEDDFYREDLAGRYHVFDLTFDDPADMGSDEDYYVEVTMNYNPTRTHIIASAESIQLEGGDLTLIFRADASFLSLGEQPNILNTAVKRGTGGWSFGYETVEGATARVASRGETTFFDIAATNCPDGVSIPDFYNAAVGFLNDSFDDGGGLYSTDLSSLGLHDFMCWYTYSLTVPAGGTVVNTVTAPLYPSIAGGDFEYTYYLSPAHRWASFGRLEVEVNTPFEVSFYQNERFEKTDTGYRWEREGLPLGELYFTISQGNYAATGITYFSIFCGVLAGGALLFILLLVGLSLLLVFLLTRKKKKKK